MGIFLEGRFTLPCGLHLLVLESIQIRRTDHSLIFVEAVRQFEAPTTPAQRGQVKLWAGNEVAEEGGLSAAAPAAPSLGYLCSLGTTQSHGFVLLSFVRHPGITEGSCLPYFVLWGTER